MIQFLLEAFLISAVKKCPIYRKSTFSLIYFPLKIPSSTDILFPTPLKSKVEQGWHFRKTSIPRGYSVSLHTNTLQNVIPLTYKNIIKTNIKSKTALSLMSATTGETRRTFLLTFRIVYFWNCSWSKKNAKYFHSL